MGVIPSVAKHLAFSVTHEDEIFRLLPHQEDVATQSVAGGFQTRPTRSLLLSLTGDQCFDKLSIPSPVEDRLPLRLLTLCYLPSTIWLYALCSYSLLSYCNCAKNPFRSSSAMMLLSMNSDGFLFLNRGSVKATLSSSN